MMGGGGTAKGGGGGRRSSAASISGYPTMPAPGDCDVVVTPHSGSSGGGGQHCLLNPNSAWLTPSSSGFKPERRRNSYAAGVIPELYVQTITEMSPTLAQHSGGQQQPHHHHQYGSQHFLDPNNAAQRRRLPPTPLDLANGRLSGSHELLLTSTGSFRRSSSPRILPTPPAEQLLQPILPQQQPQPPSFTSNSTSPTSSTTSDALSPQPAPQLSPFERRRSIRRQLPAEPVVQQPKHSLQHHSLPQPQQQQQQMQEPTTTTTENATAATYNNNNKPPQQQQKPQIKFASPRESPVEKTSDNMDFDMVVVPPGKPTDVALMCPVVNILQRSSSTRSARIESQRRSNYNNNSNNATLPPSSPRHQQSLDFAAAENNFAEMPPLPRLSRTASAALSPRRQRRSLVVTAQPLLINNNSNGAAAAALNGAGQRDGSGGADALLNHQEQAATTKMTTNNNSGLTPPPPTLQQQTAASAPASPREQSSPSSTSTDKNLPSPVHHQHRKYSTDSHSATIADDLATISSLNLQRNGSGSMAYLLEQQHILRREFTSLPAAAAAVNNHVENNNNQQQSNCSSLSPSMEKLNYPAVNSRSGSDAEIVANPSVLGFDPTLYTTNGPSSAHGSYCSGSANSIHSALPSEPTTSIEEQQQHPRPKGLGLIHCALQYFPVRKRLRVSVLKIEGLAGELRPDLEIQPFCKLTLTPGKKQQQQSVVKRGRDAVFNQEFFFDNLAPEEIEQKQLQIEVCHNSAQKLQKDMDIGEVRIPLRDLATQLHSKKEVRIVEELKLFFASKKLGRLQITTCIEKEARRLTINLIKAEDLPKWGIVGAPDVQIRIKMQQSNGPEVVKSSRVLKNTTTAIYKEAVMFLVSTKKADLARTKITISVHDLSRSVTGNDVIGCVFLGALAMDKSEVDQWRNTMDHWGKEYKGVHSLKSDSDLPNVHVFDVREEEDEQQQHNNMRMNKARGSMGACSDTSN